MNARVELADAFEAVEIELPDNLHAWFVREAAAKKCTLDALLSAKTAGLTVAQLAAARAHGEDIPRYVLRWILRQPHEIAGGDIPIG